MYEVSVLVVDDQERERREIATAARQTLMAAGLEPGKLHEAGDLESALRYIKSEPVDIALIDLALDCTDESNVDGLEVARELKKHNTKCQCVLVTGKLDAAESRKLPLDAFADNIVQKRDKYIARELRNAVRRAASAFVELLNRGDFAGKIGRGIHRTMWGLGRQGGKKGLQHLKVPIPPLADESVVVQTMSLGICGTDSDALEAEQASDHDLVEFHEACGVVVWAGRDVEPGRLSVGDLVIPVVRRCQTWDTPGPGGPIDFRMRSCPLSATCESYRRPDACPRGEYPVEFEGQHVGYRSRGTGKCHGFGTEFFADTPEWLVRACTSEEVKDYPQEFIERLILCEPLAVVWKMKREIDARRRVQPFHDRMLTLGLGPIGYLATLVMHRMNPGLRCTGVDRVPEDRPWIRYLTERAVPQIAYHQLEESETWCGKLDHGKYNMIIEATGHPQAVIGHAIEALAPGGILVLLSFGSPGDPPGTGLGNAVTDIVRKGGVIIGSVNEAREDFENAVEFLKSFHSKDDSPLDDFVHREEVGEDVVQRVRAIRGKPRATRQEGPKIILDAIDHLSKGGKATVAESLALRDC